MERRNAFVVPDGVDFALVFVAPDHQLEEARQQVESHRPAIAAALAVLVDDEEVEPVARLRGLEEGDVVLLEHARETLVGNISHPVDRQVSGTLLQQDGLDLDVVDTM